MVPLPIARGDGQKRKRFPCVIRAREGYRRPSAPARGYRSSASRTGPTGLRRTIRHFLARMTNGEREEDLREAPDEREEADPEQDQGRALSERVHAIGPRHPEREEDEHDPGNEVQPPSMDSRRVTRSPSRCRRSRTGSGSVQGSSRGRRQRESGPTRSPPGLGAPRPL